MLPHEPPLSAFATDRWRAIYAGLSDAQIAAELRDWRAWRDQQISAHLAHAEAIESIWRCCTAFLRAEARRRLAPKPKPGRRMTTARLLAAFPDRLRPAGADRWRCRCPWHDDRRPSLIVYADGHCHCYTCHAHRPVAELAAVWTGAVAA